MPQLTLADFERRVWDRVENNTIFYTQAEVDRLVNEGARVVNLFAGFSQGTVTVGLTVQGWMWYRTPAPIIFSTNVYLDGKEIQKSTIAAASQMQPTWFRGITNRRTVQWIPLGIGLFALSPPDLIGGKLLEVQGVTTPALLVNPDDSLTLDDSYADLITDYAVMNLTLKEGGKVSQDSMMLYNPWMKRIKELERWTNRSNPRFWLDISKKTEQTAA